MLCISRCQHLYDVCLHACAEQGSSEGSINLGAASACSIGALLLSVGGAARADEEGFSQGPDVLTSVLFTLTAVALGVLSIGVSFLDTHQDCLTREQQTALSVKLAAA